MNFYRRFSLAAILFLCVGNCSSEGPNYDSPATYFSTMQSLTVDIFYEPGAEPFVGTFSASLPTPFKNANLWNITRENLAAVFQGRSTAVSITVPDSLDAMTALPTQNRTTWTAEQVFDLWTSQRQRVSTPTAAYFFLVFLNGYFESEGAAQPQVIGVSITGTPVIAIFKQVVESTGFNPDGGVPKFVEQSTVVHEMGHALGLVNNGVALTSAHHDSANGAHCTNTSCTMYYANEGLTSAIAFAQSAIAAQSFLLLKEECLNDTRAFAP
jgi:predicted Zn-dependent protease